MKHFKKIEVDGLNFEEKTLLFDEKFIFTVNYKNVKYEFFMNLQTESNKLLVMGNGAFNPEKGSLPVFQRSSWVDEIDESVIIYNDPTLYKGKINLGWGQYR